MSDSLLLFPRSLSPARTEWIGNRYTLPDKVRDGGATYHPEVVMWMELPSGLLLSATPFDPRQSVPFARIVGDLIADLPDDSSCPSRIRVPDKGLADEVRRRVGEIPVLVGAVPELDEAFAQLARATADGVGPSYLDGEIPPTLIAKLFSAAAAFFRAAPWRHLAEDQLVRADLPQLGIEGACLSVIGGAGESFALLLFPSIDAFEEFAEMPPEMFDNETLDFEDGPTFILSLSFGRRKELPSRMLREIEEHRWPVAGPKAYPMVMAMNENRRPKPATARDVAVMTACAAAFTSFFEHHRDRFPLDAVSETFPVEEGMSVTLTAPFPGDEDRLVAGQETFRADPKTGRNDPCPCGSGKKYKKCHLGREPRDQASEKPMTVHEMDEHLVLAIGNFALARFGRGWIGRAAKGFIVDDISLPLFFPWMTWTAVAGGRRVADAFVEENGSGLGRDERDWIAAQRSAWLSVWEVVAVARGQGMEIRDLLTGETRKVREILASQTLSLRDALLARVVDFRDTSFFAGMFARSLPPIEAAEVVRHVRSKARAGKGVVAVGRLQDPSMGRFMIDSWREAVDDFDERRSKPPALQNTDGDPLLFVTETFAFDPEQRAGIERRLIRLAGARGESGDRGEVEVTFVRADDTVTGRVVVSEGTLRIETNSEKRAEALAEKVRNACGETLRRVRRKTKDPAKVATRKRGKPKRATPAEQALVREAKTAHYRKWPDVPVPFLDGKTPRAAARSKRSRETLDLLLRDIENHEARLPEGERIDIAWLRRELGLT